MASLPYPRSPLNYLPTEVSGREEPPTDCMDVHRLGGYGIPAIPTQPLNYLPTEVSGREEPPTETTEPTETTGARYSPTVVSVGSANSVGGYARFAWLVHLRQVHPLGGWRGYGRMPYPPTKTPTDCTDAHRLGAKTQPKNL